MIAGYFGISNMGLPRGKTGPARLAVEAAIQKSLQAVGLPAKGRRGETARRQPEKN